MTFLVFLGFLLLVIAMWAPARIRALRSGFAFASDLSHDTDRSRTLSELSAR